MAEQKREGKIVTITGMSVAGGDLKLPKNTKYFVNIKLDYSDCTPEKVIEMASGGQSVRVMAQAKLRADEDTLKNFGIQAESLKDAVDKGLNKKSPVTFNVDEDFESDGVRGPRDQQKVAAKAFRKMSRDERVQFVMDTLGVTKDIAENMVPQETGETGETGDKENTESSEK